MTARVRVTAIRGPALTYTGDPFQRGLEATMVYEPDAMVAMSDGKITHFGPARQVRARLPRATRVEDYGRDALLLFASHPALLAPTLRIVHRVIATFLIQQAGLKRAEAQSGAVTLIQRFGSAANLNKHA